MLYSHGELLFNHLFYGVTDVIYLGLYIMAVLIIRSTPWRVHLSWIVPFAIQCGLQVINRTIVNCHYLLGISLSDSLFHFGRMCNYTSDIIGLYGTVILVRTLRHRVNGTLPALPDDNSERVTEDMIWPPPPTRLK